MDFRKHKLIMLLSAVLILIGISVSAVAVSVNKKPDISSGSFQNLYADRIEITVENTEFEIKKASAEAETVTLSLFITLRKTQPDFYGILNNLTFSGIAYDNIVFTALNSNTENKTPTGLILGATDKTADTYKWQMDVTFSVVSTGTYPAILTFDYTTGFTYETSQQKILEIPVTINVK